MVITRRVINSPTIMWMLRVAAGSRLKNGTAPNACVRNVSANCDCSPCLRSGHNHLHEVYPRFGSVKRAPNDHR